jgi:DNA-binding transcriptional LysR family regulator
VTLDHLRIFVAVAEREHVGRAAEDLNLTQSAVSGALQALERRHQVVSLFNRIGRRIEISQNGKIFLEEARAEFGVRNRKPDPVFFVAF